MGLDFKKFLVKLMQMYDLKLHEEKYETNSKSNWNQWKVAMWYKNDGSESRYEIIRNRREQDT